MTSNNKVPWLELKQEIHMKYEESYFIFIQSTLPWLQHFHILLKVTQKSSMASQVTTYNLVALFFLTSSMSWNLLHLRVIFTSGNIKMLLTLSGWSLKHCKLPQSISLSWKNHHEHCAKVTASLLASALIIILAPVCRIHCLMVLLPWQILCGIHPV